MHVHVYKANLVDFKTQILYIKKKSLTLNVLPKKFTHTNGREKFCTFAFHKQSHSLKFQKVGRYDFVNNYGKPFYYLLCKKRYLVSNIRYLI